MRTTGAAEVVAAIGTRLDRRPLAVLLDVDGTLAPIAPRPADARVPEETRRVVQALVTLPGVHVAAVSGRAASDSARLVGVPGIWVLGNHGMETQSPDGALHADPDAQRFDGAVASAARELERLARETSGALVENKRWTLSFHYRLVDERSVAALVAAAREIGESAGLRVTEGKKVVELRPPVAVDKGTASVALVERVGALDGGAVLFAGDDNTDEDAFRALRERAPGAVTVRIGPAGVETAAEFRLESPQELRDLLAAVASRASAGG